MEEDSKFSYEKETSRLAGMATFRFGSTMCKFQSGFSSRFDIFYFARTTCKIEKLSNVTAPKIWCAEKQ